MSIGSDNGLVLCRRHAVTWTNAYPVNWHICSTRGWWVKPKLINFTILVPCDMAGLKKIFEHKKLIKMICLREIFVLHFRDSYNLTSKYSGLRLINSLRPHDAIWCDKFGSTSNQVMTCCLLVPIHYLIQCWLAMKKTKNHISLYLGMHINAFSWTWCFCCIKISDIPKSRSPASYTQ